MITATIANIAIPKTVSTRKRAMLGANGRRPDDILGGEKKFTAVPVPAIIAPATAMTPATGCSHQGQSGPAGPPSDAQLLTNPAQGHAHPQPNSQPHRGVTRMRAPTAVARAGPERRARFTASFSTRG